ncbi:MAG TPA: flagellar basal body P-ring formation chaperone FlgA [Gammaproteobacteria bacterium]
MNKGTYRRLAALAALVLAAATAAGAELEDHARIRSLAEAHALEAARSFAPAGARVSVEAARLDPRLRLAACPVVPETFSAPGHGLAALASIGVRCPATPGWSLYVPVEVEVLVDVVVLAAPAATGEALAASDLRLEPANVVRLGAGYLTRIEDAEGQVLKRPVRPGTVLTAALLERPTLVRRGQRVELVAGGAALAVRSEGEALSDAAEGERVRVRNVRSRTVVEGVVAADGTVRIGG